MKLSQKSKPTVRRISTLALLSITLSAASAGAQEDSLLGEPVPEESGESEPEPGADSAALEEVEPEAEEAEEEASNEDDASEASETEEASEEPEASVDASDEEAVEGAPEVEARAEDAGEPLEGNFRPIWQGLVGDNNRFGFDGGMETDVGFADYTFSEDTRPPETFHDFRGQFWLTPVLEHRFGQKQQAFVRAKAEFVAWLRDEPTDNKFWVFDAFAQTGIDDIADLAIGRVTTWSIFRGDRNNIDQFVFNGFDIFTLEDTGCLTQPGYDGGNFCARAYEVDKIWLRGIPGRAVLNLYPLKKILPDQWNNLGIQAAAEYGKEGNSNVLGARGAAVYSHKWARLAAGAEYRETKKADREWEDGEVGVVCQKCLWNFGSGYGFSAVARPPYLNAGYNYADATGDGYNLNGEKEDGNSNDNLTRGAFVELHTGHLIDSVKKGPRPAWHADQRSENIRKVTVGYTEQRIEAVRGNGDYEVHTKRAGYLKYNLGFNQAFLKLVVSMSDSEQYNLVSAEGAPAEYDLEESDMLAGRLRFAYYW